MLILPLFFCLFGLANAPESDKRDLKSELEMMKTLKPHPHVIKLLGCVTETGKCICGLYFDAAAVEKKLFSMNAHLFQTKQFPP